jgi:hypothetical protein
MTSTSSRATANLTLRVSTTLLERIDQAAERHGQTRTTYVLSWLPEYRPEPTDDGARSANPGRAGRSGGRRKQSADPGSHVGS